MSRSSVFLPGGEGERVSLSVGVSPPHLPIPPPYTMGSPELAVSPRRGRLYVWPPDSPEVEYPSVTTILGELSKPALTNWAAKLVAEFAYDNRQSWAGLPSPGELRDTLIEQTSPSLTLAELDSSDVRSALPDPLDRDSALALLKGAPWRDRDRKGDVGNAIHHALEHDGMVEGGMEGYIHAARDFLSDTGFRLRSREQTIFNDTWAYAGTVDGYLVREVEGETEPLWSMVDWKTGKALYPDYALQMVAYLMAEWAAVQVSPSQWAQHVIPSMPEGGWVVRLGRDGKYDARRVLLSKRLWRAFCGLRSIRAWTDSTRQRWWAEARKGGAAK